MWRRNPDIDLQQARRLAVVNGGEDMQKYFAMLWRIHPNRAKDEAYRFEDQNISAFETYVDFVIQMGELDEGSRADALKYMQSQRFAWLFEPTPIDQVREEFKNHEDVCHADDYPGHCCLQNLTEIYEKRDREYVIVCRLCRDEGNEIPLGGYNPDNLEEDQITPYLEWADTGSNVLPCAWERDDEYDDHYRRNPPRLHAQDIGDHIAYLRQQLGLTVAEFSKLVFRYWTPQPPSVYEQTIKRYEAGVTACGTVALLQRMKRIADRHKIPFMIRKEWLPLAAQNRYPGAFTEDGWLKGRGGAQRVARRRRRSRPNTIRLVEPNDEDLVAHLFELQELVNSNPHWHNWVRILEHAQKTGATVFIEHPEYPPILMTLKSVSRGGQVAAGNAVAVHPHRHQLDNEVIIHPWKLKNCRAHLEIHTPDERAERREDYWRERTKAAVRKMIYGKDVLEDALDIKKYRNLYYSKTWAGTQYPQPNIT